MSKAKSIFRNLSEKQIYQSLKKKFNHPGTTLFRGREINALINYTNNHPLPYKTKILDLGCGEGYIGQIVFNKIDVGTDILPSELARAKRTKIYSKLKIEDARKMTFKDKSFDLVFSNSVIEHIDGINDVISEVSRILRKSGYFIFTVPTSHFTTNLFFYKLFKKLNLNSLAKIYATKRNSLLNHYNLFDHLGWMKRLEKKGLKVKDYSYYLDSADIQWWDVICIILRLTAPIPPLNKIFKSAFSVAVDKLIKKPNALNIKGSGLLIVATKK